ncbi:hypothetical protein NN6n1_34690 [Shinella zoogloeoides]
MSRKPYAIGDRVVLKAGLTRSPADERTCRIVSLLPADHGEVQYRVQREGETFERRIVHSDIDTAESAVPASRDSPASPGKAGSWLKPSSIRAGR